MNMKISIEMNIGLKMETHKMDIFMEIFVVILMKFFMGMNSKRNMQ